MKEKLPKIIAVAGPTSSGKSDLAIWLAQKWNGEIISADSRQVYRGLDIATGKITEKEMCGIPHHLLDIADPKDQYTVSHFKHDAEKAIHEILLRKKLPILCGGTMQYIDAVTENFVLPDTVPDKKLRRELEAKSTEQLFSELKIIDPIRAKNIDCRNRRRLIRAIEIAQEKGFVPKIPAFPKKYDSLKITIKTDKELLRARIRERVEKRFADGMIEEAKTLHMKGLTLERMENLGLEYRYLAKFLKGEITEEKLKEEIFFKNWQYSKRQMTWLKRDAKIQWFLFSDKEVISVAVENFLKSSDY